MRARDRDFDSPLFPLDGFLGLQDGLMTAGSVLTDAGQMGVVSIIY